LFDVGLEGEKFILVFFRVLSVLWLLPLFQSRTISAGYKAGLSLLITFLIYGGVTAPQLQGDTYLLLLAVAREILIGLTIGFMVRIMFSMINASGEVIAMQAGLSFSRTVDPIQSVQVTVIEQFTNLLGIMIFLGIDGHHTVIRSLSVTLREIPPGAAVARMALFQYLIQFSGKLFAAALKICAPVIVTLFLVEIALGLLSRLIPQVNVFVEGASLKILLSLIMLAFSLNLIVPIIGGLFKGMDGEILKIIRCLV
jgi:flagellar biosynthesis protein FliR